MEVRAWRFGGAFAATQFHLPRSLVVGGAALPLIWGNIFVAGHALGSAAALSHRTVAPNVLLQMCSVGGAPSGRAGVEWGELCDLWSALRPLTRFLLIKEVMKKLQVTLCQISVGHDRCENLAKVQKFIAAAAARGSKLVVLPECFSCPYGTQYFKKFAEKIEAGNPTFDCISAIAKEKKLWVVAGSIPEITTKGEYFNTSLTFNPTGVLQHVHRKIHLFRIRTEEVTMDESEVLSAGSEAKCVAMDDGTKFGVGICFDIRYPQLSWKYATEGSSFLVYPGAFNKVTGPLHWELCGRSRAVDSQQYVILCSPAQNSSADYVAWGHSMVVDPFGRIVDQLDETEGYLDAILDFGINAEAREKLPILSGERKDLYGLTWS